MLLEGYTREFCRPPNPEAEHLRCVASLDTDITEVLPYLNTVLGGHQYFSDPPSLTLKLPGKLVTLYARKIAINILKDEQEAAMAEAANQQHLGKARDHRSLLLGSISAPGTGHLENASQNQLRQMWPTDLHGFCRCRQRGFLHC